MARFFVSVQVRLGGHLLSIHPIPTKSLFLGDANLSPFGLAPAFDERDIIEALQIVENADFPRTNEADGCALRASSAGSARTMNVDFG